MHRTIEGVFWIRLFGVLVEIDNNYKSFLKLFKVKTYEDFEKQYHEKFSTCSEYKFIFDITSEIELIRKSLSLEELVAIDNFRQTNCHVLQKGYQLGVKSKKGVKTLKDRYFVSTVPKDMAIKDIDMHLNNYMKKYSANMLQMAYDISSKVKPHIEKIYQVYKASNL